MCWITHVLCTTRKQTPYRSLVLARPLLEVGMWVQRVLANRAPTEVEQAKPEALDLIDRKTVVGVGIDREANIVRLDIKRVGEEPPEQQDHVRV